MIVEVRLGNGLDVLAVFRNATARYINHTGKLLVWKTSDEQSLALTRFLFANCQPIVDQIGTGKIQRRPYSGKGFVRLTLLHSDGLEFGEGASDALFADPLAGPAPGAAAQQMQSITGKAL